MGVLKLATLDPSLVTITGDYILYNNEPLHLQSNFQSIRPYGLPKKNEYHKTDESRMYYQVPITDNEVQTIIKDLDKLCSSKLQAYVNMLKEGKNGNPPSIKIKFTKETFFTLVDEKTNELTVLEYDNIDDLDKKMRFYYDFRFLISIRLWRYMGKSGVTLLASHVQAIVKNSQPVEKDFI